MSVVMIDIAFALVVATVSLAAGWCLRGGEAGWIQSEWGLVDSEYWAGFREIIKHVVGSEGGRKAFDQNRRILNPQFADEVERILSEMD